MPPLMRLIAAMSMLLLVACTQEPERPMMGAEQHCQMAASLAVDGDCLSAGQHLSYCAGALRTSTVLYTHHYCARSARSVVATGPVPMAPQAQPPPRSSEGVDPWAPAQATPERQAANVPPATTTEPAGDKLACDEAVALAMSGGCANALLALDRCPASQRRPAESAVTSWCSRTMPAKPQPMDMFGGRH